MPEIEIIDGKDQQQKAADNERRVSATILLL
jgi:hypothetical protein